jgi:hypothetical protein
MEHFGRRAHSVLEWDVEKGKVEAPVLSVYYAWAAFFIIFYYSVVWKTNSRKLLDCARYGGAADQEGCDAIARKVLLKPLRDYIMTM